jgi:hypothetical protein
MRVVQATKFGGPEVLVPSEAAEPVAGPSQVVVEVSVAPVLFLDTQIRSGSACVWFPATPPYVPGRGVAGAVSSVGAGVDPDWVGCRVVADTADGGYLERAVVTVEGLIAVPEGLGMAEAAALLHDGRTAVSLIGQAYLRAGERVLVLGAGGGARKPSGAADSRCRCTSHRCRPREAEARPRRAAGCGRRGRLRAAPHHLCPPETAGKGRRLSCYEIVQVLAPAPDVAVAQVRRVALTSVGRALEPASDVTGAFSEMALYVLVLRDRAWWLPLGRTR